MAAEASGFRDKEDRLLLIVHLDAERPFMLIHHMSGKACARGLLACIVVGPVHAERRIRSRHHATLSHEAV